MAHVPGAAVRILIRQYIIQMILPIGDVFEQLDHWDLARFHHVHDLY